MMTLAEIAAYANVSTGTVDRVLHNRKGVSPKTKELIETIIKEQGYKPNPIASQLKKKKSFVIGVLVPLLDSGCGYYKALVSGMKEAKQSLEPFQTQLEVMTFNRTISGEYINKLTELLTKDIDALITSPVVPDEFMTMLSHLESIPYVFIDTPLTMTKPLFTIAQNPYKSGYCAGRVMKLLQGSGTFACIRMFEGAYNLRERYRGFAAFMSQDTGSKVIDAVCTNFSPEGLYEFLEELFALHPDIKGIFIPHTEVQLATYFLINTGLKSRVSLIGYDLLENNKPALLEGSIDCIIGQRPKTQGFDAVTKLFRSCVLNQKFPEKMDVSIDIYFKETVM